MQKCGAEQQRQHACESLIDGESQQAEQPEANQASQHAYQDVRAIADDDAADAGIGAFVIIENRQILEVGSEHVRRQHQERLADAIPAIELAAAPMDAKLRILLRKNRRFGCPKGVRGAQTVSSIAGAQLSRLHHHSGEHCNSDQQKGRIAKKTAETNDHSVVSYGTFRPRRI